MLRVSQENNDLTNFIINSNVVENLVPEILNLIFSDLNLLDLQSLAYTSKYLCNVAVWTANKESEVIKIFIDSLCKGLNSEIFPVEKEKLRAIRKEIKFFETQSLVKTKTKIYEIREKIINFLIEHKIKTFKENLETFPYSIESQCVPKFFEHLYELVDIYLCYKFENAADEWIEENEDLYFSPYERYMFWHDNLKSDPSKYIGIAKTILDADIKSSALYTIFTCMDHPLKALEIANIIPDKLKKNKALARITKNYNFSLFQEFSEALTFFLSVVNNIEGEDKKSKSFANVAFECLKEGSPEEALKIKDLINVPSQKVAGIFREISLVLSVKVEAFQFLRRGLIIESIEKMETVKFYSAYVKRIFEKMINELIETKNYNAAVIFLKNLPITIGNECQDAYKDAYKGWVKKLMISLINDDFFDSAFYVASFINNGNLNNIR